MTEIKKVAEFPRKSNRIQIKATVENCYHDDLRDSRNVAVSIDGVAASMILYLSPPVAARLAALLNNAEDLLAVVLAYREADRLEEIAVRCELPADQEAFEKASRRATILGGFVMGKLGGVE